jgi:hypothetical protein
MSLYSSCCQHPWGDPGSRVHSRHLTFIYCDILPRRSRAQVRRHLCPLSCIEVLSDTTYKVFLDSARDLVNVYQCHAARYCVKLKGSRPAGIVDLKIDEAGAYATFLIRACIVEMRSISRIIHANCKNAGIIHCRRFGHEKKKWPAS